MKEMLPAAARCHFGLTLAELNYYEVLAEAEEN